MLLKEIYETILAQRHRGFTTAFVQLCKERKWTLVVDCERSAINLRREHPDLDVISVRSIRTKLIGTTKTAIIDPCVLWMAVSEIFVHINALTRRIEQLVKFVKELKGKVFTLESEDERLKNEINALQENKR